MSFIRVTLKHNGVKVNLNSANISSFSDASDSGSVITMTNDDDFEVTDSARSLRGYIKKAQGTLPAKAGEESAE